MSRYMFRVPDIGEGTAEVELVAWHVKIGDFVEEDQLVADLMTEKATVETPSPVKGRVLALLGMPGQMLAVGSPLLEFEISETGDVVAAAAPIVETPIAPPAPVTTAPAAVVPAVTIATPVSRTLGEKPVASPAVRAKALAAGVPLQFVAGSGPGGRVTHDDLDFYLSGGETSGAVTRSQPAPNAAITDVPVIGLRRRIAQQMQESKRRIPHFSYVEEIDVTDLEELRVYLNETRKPGRPKLTVLPFIIRALARVLPDYPQMNARYDDEAGIVHRYAALHLGVATQTPNGLIVPVIRDAETHDLWALADEIARLAEATRAGTARREELTGSTLTLTSLGPLGGVSHTPVINHPEVAIVGPNKIVERPVVRHGAIVVRKMMNISSSFDHRVVDGWDAASFIQQIRTLLERPALLFLDAP
jgi:2-oxoisovalerate dehydrogenase E2 component (dihydrolipoyl transacylase)